MHEMKEKAMLTVMLTFTKHLSCRLQRLLSLPLVMPP